MTTQLVAATPVGAVPPADARRLSRLRLGSRFTDARPPVTAPILPLWLACLTAVGGGIALVNGFPGTDIWPLTLLGVALVLLSLIGRTWKGAVLVGLIAGLTFWG